MSDPTNQIQNKYRKTLVKNFPLFAVENLGNQPNLNQATGPHLEAVNTLVITYSELLADPAFGFAKVAIDYLQSIGIFKNPDEIYDVTTIRKILKKSKVSQANLIDARRRGDARFNATKDTPVENAFYSADYGILGFDSPTNFVLISWENFNNINQYQNRNTSAPSRLASEADALLNPPSNGLTDLNLTPEQLQALSNQQAEFDYRAITKERLSAKEQDAKWEKYGNKASVKCKNPPCKVVKRSSGLGKKFTQKYVKEAFKQIYPQGSVSKPALLLLINLSDKEYLNKVLETCYLVMSKGKKKRLTENVLQKAYKLL